MTLTRSHFARERHLPIQGVQLHLEEVVAKFSRVAALRDSGFFHNSINNKTQNWPNSREPVNGKV